MLKPFMLYQNNAPNKHIAFIVITLLSCKIGIQLQQPLAPILRLSRSQVGIGKEINEIIRISV